MTKIQRIGFIGLGMMGGPMAKRLAEAGYDLSVLDANDERTATVAELLGANVLTNESASTLDALITMLPNSSVVESVLFGADGKQGWANRLKHGVTVIDMSSSEPVRSRAVSSALGKIGVRYLDAPVSGGVLRAEKGTLAILVGGPAALLDEHAALLGKLGSTQLHIGDAGAGHAAKALNNFVSAAGLVATVEALHVAKRFGIDPQKMTDVLNASSGRSNTSENKVKQFMLSGSFSSGFALQLMKKDLTIANALADSVGYPMTLGKVNLGIWTEASNDSTPTTDHTEMYRILRGAQDK
ncbi:NAD(P)-dependent oxidoreductase [Paraburkholderia xenovorans]